jgi:hypothetical protein
MDGAPPPACAPAGLPEGAADTDPKERIGFEVLAAAVAESLAGVAVVSLGGLEGDTAGILPGAAEALRCFSLRVVR